MNRFLVLAAGLLATGTAAAIDDLHFYFGVDQAETDVTTYVNIGSDGDPATPETLRGDFESSMLRLRGGVAVNENLAFELQYGLEGDSTDLSQDPPTIGTDSYLGVFLVPSAYVFDFLQLEVPIGYAEIEFDGAEDSIDDRAYGVNFNFYPLRVFKEEGSKLVSLSGGYMVYHRGDDTRVDGYNFGLKILFGNDE